MNDLSQLKQGVFAPGHSAEMAEALVAGTGIRIDVDRRRGRGAALNISGRFEPKTREVFDDGWQTIEELPPFKTEVQIEKPKTAITRNDSPDISFDRSINPYRGCEHEKRKQGERAALALVVRTQQEKHVFYRDDDRQGPDHQRDQADDLHIRHTVVRDGAQGFAEGIERTGPDIAIDDADGAKRQNQQAPGILHPMSFISKADDGRRSIPFPSSAASLP